MEHIANPTDEALQDLVETALRDTLGHDAPHIGVAADHGTVTLTGEVGTDALRLAAHAVTLEVWGVHSVADDISVHGSNGVHHSDTELAKAAQKALQHAPGVLTDTVVAEVRGGVVTLTGRVESAAERIAAERAVTCLPGIAEIDNRVAVDA
ncbi:MAG TPA: BON domain-containing protein [Mycobacteriales bacterium]|nr:BON domain-containing protein [Mycobacteriales bacterium]